MADLDIAIQEALVAMLCYDDSPKGARLVRTLIRPKQFDAYYRDIAQAADKHLERFGRVPGEHTLDIVESLKAKQESAADIYERIFQSLQETAKGIQPEYIVDKARTFARKQRLKDGATKLIESLETDDLDAAEKAISESLKSSYDLFDPGMLFNDPRQALTFLDEDDTQNFPTGIKELDKLGLGPARKRLHVFFALYRMGKSWWLVHLAKMALLNGKKVLYVSLELSKEDIAQRLQMSMFAVSKRDEIIKRMRFKTNEFGHFLKMDQKTISKRLHFKDKRIRKKLLKKMQPLMNKPSLYVRQFPTGSITVRELEAFMDGLQGSLGFIPDLLLVDYPDLMQFDPKFERQELSKIYKELRGLAVSRNMAVAVVTQSNREGESVKTIKGKQVGGDFSKLQTADYVLTYSQTEAEHALGLARIYQLKGRTDMDRFTLLIAQAYGIGQFCLDSARMVRADGYWHSIEGDKEED